MSLYCGCTGCERFLQPALGPFCQACGIQLVSFCAPPPIPLTSTEQWVEYPLTGSDAGATHFDPLWSAGLQSTEVSPRSMKRSLYLFVIHTTLLLARLRESFGSRGPLHRFGVVSGMN